VGVTLVHLGLATDAHHYGGVCVDYGGLVLQDCAISSLGGAGVYVQGEHTTARVVDCYVHASLQSGILASQGARVVLEKCQITENYLDGVCIQHGASLHASRCRINCNDRGVQVLGATSKATVEFNEIVGNERDSLHIDPDCRSNVVSRCNEMALRAVAPSNIGDGSRFLESNSPQLVPRSAPKNHQAMSSFELVM
jgi:hypothetical protein